MRQASINLFPPLGWKRWLSHLGDGRRDLDFLIFLDTQFFLYIMILDGEARFGKEETGDKREDN